MSGPSLDGHPSESKNGEDSRAILAETTEKMIVPNRIAHLLLVSSLAACLGLAGIVPPLLDAPAAAEPASPTTSPCCCGTVEGRCCGQACCGAVPSDDAPQPFSNSQARPCLPDPLLALLATGGFAVVHPGRHLRVPSAQGDDLRTSPTLQADQVRLQI